MPEQIQILLFLITDTTSNSLYTNELEFVYKDQKTSNMKMCITGYEIPLILYIHFREIHLIINGKFVKIFYDLGLDLLRRKA